MPSFDQISLSELQVEYSELEEAIASVFGVESFAAKNKDASGQPKKRNCKPGNLSCGNACLAPKRNGKDVQCRPKGGLKSSPDAKQASQWLEDQLAKTEDGSSENQSPSLIDVFTKKPDLLEGESLGDRRKRWEQMKQDAVDKLRSQSKKPDSTFSENPEDWAKMKSSQSDRDGMMANLIASNQARRNWVADPNRLKESADAAKNPPFPEEVLAIKLYSTNDFGAMNGALRGLDDASYKDSINRNMAEGRSLNDIRAEAIRDSKVVAAGLNSLPPYGGTVYRGVRVPDGMTLDDIKRSYAPGSTVTERGFTSTSKDTSASFADREGVPIQMIINSRNGRSIEELSETRSEKEVLFRPFTQFKVLKQEESNGQLVIYMDEV